MAEDYRQRCLNHSEERCQECRSTESIVVHHIDGDQRNNELDNLMPLCQSCHVRVHHGVDGFEHLTEQLPDEAIIFRETENYRPQIRFQSARADVVTYLERQSCIALSNGVRTTSRDHLNTVLFSDFDRDCVTDVIDAIVDDETNPVREQVDGGLYLIDMQWATQFTNPFDKWDASYV